MKKQILVVLVAGLGCAQFVLATDLPCTVMQVESSIQGVQFNLAPIPAARSNPDNILNPVPDNHFFSLGFYPQGSVTLVLAEALESGEITIWETTWRNGNYCLETADVLVADETQSSWITVGVADNNRGAGADFHLSEFSFDEASLGFCVKYVRIVETSDLGEIAARCGTGDGFDVDAVCVSGLGCAPAPTVEAEEVPVTHRLKPNWPNPFNPTTTINYDVAETGMVKLAVYNLAGDKVAQLVDGMQEAGSHSLRFDASALPSGVYFCRLESGGMVDTRKLTLLK